MGFSFLMVAVDMVCDGERQAGASTKRLFVITWSTPAFHYGLCYCIGHSAAYSTTTTDAWELEGSTC
jgi:hypothetical protein